MRMRILAVLAAIVVSSGLCGCGGGGGSGGSGGSGGGGPGSSGTGGVTLQSISLAPSSSSLGVGASQGFAATGNYSDGTTRNISDSVTWTSSDQSIASITASGVTSALTLGAANISAAASGVTGTTPLNVTNKTLRSIAVTPAFVSGNTGTTQQLTATGTYSDGSTQNITSSATWASSDATIATVSSTGLVTRGATPQDGLAITASSGMVSARSRVSVTSPSFPLIGISLTPQAMFVGEDFPLPQVSADFSGIGQNYTFVSWTSSNPAVATVDNDRGRIKAVTAGTTTLTASTGNLTASNTLTVSQPALQSIILLPIIPNISQGAVLQMSAMGTYSDGNKKDITSLPGLVWSSGTAGVVTLGSSGIAAGVASGTSLLTATVGAVSGSTTATVPATAPVQTTVTLSPIADNTVMSSSLVDRENTVYPTTAMMTNPAIAVGCAWYYSPAIGYAPERMDASCSRAMVKFDLAGLAGKTIQSATLQLQTSIYGVGFVPRQWHVRALASSWSGSTVTWTSSKFFMHYVYSETTHNPPVYSGQTFNLDQTNTVRNWVAGSYANNGYEFGLTSLLYPQIYDISLDQFEFHSSEDSGGRGPKLIVTYQ